MVVSGFENQQDLSNMQLDNQKVIGEMQNVSQKVMVVIQSATSRQNTKDQVYAQNVMLAYQQKASTARVASIMDNSNLRSDERRVGKECKSRLSPYHYKQHIYQPRPASTNSKEPHKRLSLHSPAGLPKKHHYDKNS